MQQYSYFLEGYQKTWDPFSADPSFSYRNLPPGSYKLWVKCLDAFKNQGDNTLLLTLRVEPPFWMTWWFISLLLAVIILIVIGVVRKINEARYKARLRELQQQNAIEKERLRISKDMHDEVGASLTRISILSELARQKTGKAQETSAYIAQINEISGNVVDEMSEIIWAINPRNDNPESFASHIRQFVSNYLEPTGIIPDFRFQEPMPEFTMSSELRRNLFLTMKEAIHNLVKYSGSPNAEITLSFSDGSIHASIRDFGQGFNTLIFQKKGNGLQNMQKRIEDSGGRFNLSSVVGQGTLIEIVLPMPAK
jgi:signal transduction histidine kinase